VSSDRDARQGPTFERADTRERAPRETRVTRDNARAPSRWDAGRSGKPLAPDARARTVLHVVSSTNWSALDDLRSFVERYCERHLSRRSAERVNLACQELLEAALKCSAANGELEFELLAAGKPTARFEIRVGTEMVQARENLLRQRIKWVGSCPPSDAYRSAVDAMASGSGDEQTLALARLRAEDMSLSLKTTAAHVTLIAEGVA